MRRLLVKFCCVFLLLLPACTDAPKDGVTDAAVQDQSKISVAAGDRNGPYGDCSAGKASCSLASSVCPGDSTGKVCAAPCTTDSDCPSVAGATVKCADFHDASGNRCILSCSNTSECPSGMECVNISGAGPQCGWP